MTSLKISAGGFHKVPADLKKILTSNSNLLERWNALTQIARDEWICWVTIFKKPETRQNHLERLQSEILEGKRRPCCWAGCPHRNPNAQKWYSKPKIQKRLQKQESN